MKAGLIATDHFATPGFLAALECLEFRDTRCTRPIFLAPFPRRHSFMFLQAPYAQAIRPRSSLQVIECLIVGVGSIDPRGANSDQFCRNGFATDERSANRPSVAIHYLHVDADFLVEYQV